MQALLFQAVTTALVNASYALLVGILTAQLWLRPRDNAKGRGVGEKLASAMAVGFGTGLVATLLALWQASATMADVPLPESGPTLWAVFAGTSYGRFGFASFALLAVAAVVHFGLRRRVQSHTYRAAITCALVLSAVCRVATGHAAQTGRVNVATAVELAHLLSMALWLGSVLVAAWVVLPQVARAKGPVGTDIYLAALSGWATVALAIVLASGLFNAFRVLNAPAELLSTPYGWVLTTKLCCVGVAIVLGSWNRFIGFPRALAVTPDPCAKNLRTITSVVRVESIALLVVLVAAAVLTASAPPTST